jgi:Arc/MetJ family transcription regulator
LQRDADASEISAMIFKGVREGRPYPDHGLSHRQWAQIPPRQIRLDELVTTTTVLALDRLLSEDSTFYGDLFPHAVRWKGIVYLEDGLHRAVRAALRNRTVLARAGVRHGHAGRAAGLTGPNRRRG